MKNVYSMSPPVGESYGETVARKSMRGHVFHEWRPPVRIKDGYLDCVFYLYPSHQHAVDGAGIGGSGFLVSVPTTGLMQNFLILYAVTNKHVVETGGTVIRMTRINGEIDILETDERAWVTHPHGDDLAVYLISINPMLYRFSHISISDFMTKDGIAGNHVGPGDDAFVVGRFINHEGKQRNLPTARFGHIAQMPDEPIVVSGFEQESFLIEARSIGGFSGSPVFWHVLPFHGGPYRPIVNTGLGPLLLGVEWGYINTWAPLCDALGMALGDGPPWVRQVEQNSGMMAVVPAWKLAELLLGGEVLRKREEIEREALEGQRKNIPLPRAFTMSSAGVKRRPDANAAHKEDFTFLLNAAAKTKPQAD